MPTTLTEGSPQIAKLVSSLINNKDKNSLSLAMLVLGTNLAVKITPAELHKVHKRISSKKGDYRREVGGTAGGVKRSRQNIDDATDTQIESYCKPCPELVYQGIPCSIASLCDYCSFLVNFSDANSGAYSDLFRAYGGIFTHDGLVRGTLHYGRELIISKQKYSLDEWSVGTIRNTRKWSLDNYSMMRAKEWDPAFVQTQFLTAKSLDETSVAPPLEERKTVDAKTPSKDVEDTAAAGPSVPRPRSPFYEPTSPTPIVKSPKKRAMKKKSPEDLSVDKKAKLRSFFEQFIDSDSE